MPIEDDMANFYDLMEKSKWESFGFTSLLFGSITAQLKAVFDRTIPRRRQRLRLKIRSAAT
jgi:multimeric flavodoxin WrbA